MDKKTNSMAFVGFFFGILSLVCCCLPVFFPLGIIFSRIGLSQINRNPDHEGGRWMAVLGMVFSLISLTIFIGLILYILYSAADYTFQQLKDFIIRMERELEPYRLLRRNI